MNRTAFLWVMAYICGLGEFWRMLIPFVVACSLVVLWSVQDSKEEHEGNDSPDAGET